MKINEKNLYVFAKTPPYDMEGFLNKRGEVNKAFQRRYFILKGNLLFYYETRLDKEPLGLIIVEGCTIELSNEVDNYCFEIAFNGNRTYILEADNQESMEKWMKALTCAGYEYKRIIVAELQRQLQEIEDARNKMLGQPDDTGSKPRPPPRRTNPFNRPAPPPPDAASVHSQLRGGVVMSPMPFINGYFGSSNAKMQQEHQQQQLQQQLMARPDGNGNAGPKRSPVPTHPSSNASKPTVLPRSNTSSNNNNSLEQQQRRAKAAEEFNRSHERYRRELMPDIEAHRQRQGQPLIQF